MRKSVKTITENKTGRNIKFKDTKTNRSFNRKEFVSKIENTNSKYHDIYHIRKINGIKTPVSNPDKSDRNNLD
mgnify:CR=1 FL=1